MVKKELEKITQGNKGTDRRSVLKAAGIAASAITISSSGVKIATAQENTSYIGNSFFTEISLEHKVQAEDHISLPIIYDDSFLDYFINPEDTKLIFEKFVKQDTKQLFSNNQKVVKTTSYQSPPATVLDDDKKKNISLKVGNDMSIAEKLQLESDYTPPKVEAIQKKGCYRNYN